MDKLDNIKNEIDIPKDLDLAIKKGIERGREEKKHEKANKSRKIYKKVAVAASIVGMVSIIGVLNPNVVKAIPGVESIFKLVGYNGFGEKLDKLEQFSTSVNKTVSNKGIKVTINEITIDDNTLAITSTIEGKNLNENKGDMGDIKLNNQLVRSYGSKAKKISDDKMVVVTEANVSDLKLSDKIDVEFSYIWISDVQGPWNFKFSVEKAKQSNSKVINIGKTIKIPNSTLKIDKLVMSPMGNTVNYSGVYDNENPGMRDGIRNFAVLDDKGRILDSRDLGGGSDKNKYEGKIEIYNDLSKVKSITVVPLFKDWGVKDIRVEGRNCTILQTTINSKDFSIPQETITKKRAVTSKEKSDGYALADVIHVYNIDKAREFSSLDNLVNQEIKVGQNNTILIKAIDANDKYTKLTFKIEGNGGYDFNNLNEAVILDENYKDVERAEDGDIAVLENLKERIVSIKLPPIDKSKKYKIALPVINEPEILDQYKVKLDIK